MTSVGLKVAVATQVSYSSCLRVSPSQPITTRQQRTNPRRVLAECLLGNNIHTHSDYTANYG